MEMLKVRVALEERLKQEGILRSKAPTDATLRWLCLQLLAGYLR